jgi:histidinol-phosphate aminotransferase
VKAHFQPHVKNLRVWRKQSHGDVLNLASNEFVHPVVDRIARDVLAGLDARTVTGYPFHGGLVERLAAHTGVRGDQLMITAGSDDAIKILADALFRTTGRLVLQEPNYELVRQYALLRLVAVTPVATREDRRFHLEDFRAAIARTGPACVYLSNPNGPLGTCLTLDELHALAGCCADAGCLLFVDEAYVPYNGFDHAPLLDAHDCVVLVRSFSKSYGVPGARLGVVMAHPDVIKYLRPWQGANPVSGMTAAVMLGFLDRAPELAAARQEIVETRDWFARAVVAALPSWTALPSHANFVNFTTDETPATWARWLLERGIRVRAMDYGCLRVTIADRRRMDRLLDLLVAAHHTTDREVGRSSLR